MILRLQSVRDLFDGDHGHAAHTLPLPFGAYPIRVLRVPSWSSGRSAQAVASAAQVAVKKGDVRQVFQALRIV